MKPTLGYPSRTAAAVALTEEGKSPQEIADLFGVSVNAVSGLISARNTRRPNERGLLALPSDVTEALRPIARQRSITIKELAVELLRMSIREGSIDRAGVARLTCGTCGDTRATACSYRTCPLAQVQA